MTIPVTPVNDAPAGTDKTVTTAEDTAYTFAAADFGFTDPNDSPANVFNRVKITTLPGAGTLKLSGMAVTAGQFITVANIPNLTFEPAANAVGSPYTTFTFQVEDDGGTTHSGVNLDPTANTLTINVVPTVTLSVNRATIAEDAGVATFTATLSSVSSLPVTVDLGFTGTATHPDDYTRSGTQIVIPAGSLSGAVAVTGVPDLNAEGNETVIVDITGVTGAAEAGTQQQTTTLLDGHAPVLTVPAAIGWWTDPDLQNREAYAPGGVGPHYWTKDESDQFLFVTTDSGGADGSAYLYSIPDLVAAHTDNVVTPVASVATATELGVSRCAAARSRTIWGGC